ncbi:MULTISPECIES: hypothetical protein [unclassified Anabaena]|uniref:hypothetical protein n=1 Tax=unclassified Anabaena TaxID=2619674 RepID=UPI0039C73CA4
MKVAVQQEDLQILAKTLQAEVMAEVPSGEVFQVKCAVQKDELMILTQHPVGVTVDTQHIFAVLETTLQSLPTAREQRVQCFLRVVGEKRPYATHSLMMKQKENRESEKVIPPSSSLTYFPPNVENDEEEFEHWVEDEPDLLTTQSPRPVKSLLLGLAVMGIGVFGSGVYLLTRPCVMSECQELQTAQRLNLESRQLMRRAKSENELVLLQQQLEIASADLTKIPHWSPRASQVEELKANLSGQAEKINQVVTALKAASAAEQQSSTTATSFEELQATQHLWRQAIAPLESIGPSSELYKLVQPKLIKYRVSLQNINQQLLAQDKWLKKLKDAKAVANVAAKRADTAKSLSEWQKAQSTWQIVINALNIIPPSSPAYHQAQQLLLEYRPQLARTRDRATLEQIAARSYQQAVNTANQAKTYEQKNQWQIAVTYWDQALQNAQQIPRDSFYYGQSQRLIAPYSSALQQAQEKLQIASMWQQTRTDLDKICNSDMRICTFMINDNSIVVSLTPDYEQVLQNTLSEADSENSSPVFDIANHWQTLQTALSVIGDNANLPLFIYDTQGEGLYTHIPGGGNRE